MSKKAEKKKLKEYALLFNSITDTLELIENATIALKKTQQRALMLYLEQADKLSIDTC